MDGEQNPVDRLTGRELDILRLMALGLSNRDIADELVIAAETVRWYTKQIYSKLAVGGRVQAINRARELSLTQDVPASATPVEMPVKASQSHLPVPITPFIGRGHQLADVRLLLRTARLLTLTGVGGTGKTRLALQAGQEAISQFADGVYFVDLAPLSHPSLVTKTVAGVLGVMENPAEPQLDTLKRALAGRELLLVIDNFEHVIEAAPLVSELLAAAPRLKVLVTSREALHLSGEQEYPVPPLSLPSTTDAAGLDESEAVALFVQRARMVQPRFEVTGDNAASIVQICARLDGLPLAIELAAARCKLLSPQAMLARLDSRLTALTGGSRDAPLRQQTLRATLDWSYNLLDESEKRLFARLSVFRGGRSLEAIQAVCGHDLPGDVFDGLTALVDKSLIQQEEAAGGEPRFILLETIHEYARERLAESGEMDAVRRRHAEFFVTLAEWAEPELRLADAQRWFQRLERELDNLRAVLQWSLNEGDLTLGVRLTGALSLFWWASGYHVEGQSWTQQLLMRLGDVPVSYHPKFLFAAGIVEIMQHNLDAAEQLLLRSVAISRTTGDRLLTAWALTYSGFAMLSEPEKAIANAGEGLAIFRELDHQPGIAQALNVVGQISAGIGDDDCARRAYAECLVVARQTGEIRQSCHAYHNITFLALKNGDQDQAWNAASEALRLALKMNSRLNIALSLAVLAGPIELRGNAQRAARLLGAAEAAFEGMGAFYQPIDKPEIDRTIAGIRAQLDDAAFRLSWDEGRTMTLEQAVANGLEPLTQR